MGIRVNYNKEYKLNQVQTWLVSSLGSISTQNSSVNVRCPLKQITQLCGLDDHYLQNTV